MSEPSGNSPPAPAEAQPAAPAAADELEPQLKYERLGADVKSILSDASATCLCLSEKVLALGTSAGTIHILDYSGNEVKRFSLHPHPVKAISFDDKAEYFASCCGDNYISVSSLYSDETNKFTFKRPITVVALEPRYASRKTREFVTGDVRGRLKLSSQGWLGRSDHVLHQGEGTIRAVTWHSSTVVWANEVGIKVYDTNMHQFVGSIKRPRGGRYADCADCQLYLHDGTTAEGVGGGQQRGKERETLYVAWPDCIKVADVLTHIDPTSGAVSKALRVSTSIPTDYFCLGVVPHGRDLAVLVYVTDADPDQTQVDDTTAAAEGSAQHTHAAQGIKQQQQQQQGGQQLTMQALPSQSHPGSSSPSKQQQQQQSDDQQATATESTAAAAEGPAASGPSTAGPINIPQPIRRGSRAANAFVRSPSGPSFLHAAAAVAATAGGSGSSAPAAAADGSTGGSTGASPGSTPPVPGDGMAAAAGRSPDAGGKVLDAAAAVQRSPSKGSAAAAAAVAGRLPLGPGHSRSSSLGSSRGATAVADGGMPVPYRPPGHPLRPELRILSLTDHQHNPPPAAAAAGTSKWQQQQQQCSACSEVASDALSVKGYSHYLPSDYKFVPSYGNEFALLSGARGSSSSTTAAAAGGAGGAAGATTPPPRSSSKLTTVDRSGSKGSSSGVTGKPAAAAAAGSGAPSSSSSSKRAAEGRSAAEAIASKSSSTADASQGGGAADATAAAAAAVVEGDSPTAAAAAAPADGTGSAADAAAEQADTAAAAAEEEEVEETEQQQQQEDLDQAQPSGAAAAADSAAAAADSAAAAAAAADVLEDFREFMYFIVSPQDIVIGRHRDMEDRISWCLAVGRCEAALALAEADRSTSTQLWDDVVQAYLESLTSAGRWSDAASNLPRLLKDSGPAWERWLFTFAQARQLPLLAPVLPVRDPLLPSQGYDLVLQALLLDPSHHSELLALVGTWPHSIFHPTKLIDTIAQRMQRPGCESRELWQVLALLYKGQGRPDLSLAIYLQLQLPAVFDFIQEHGLLLYLDRNAYLLMAIDEKRALELLTGHLDTLPPGAVVPGLLDAMSVCESRGDEGEREVWRHRLFNYLDTAFGVEPSSVSDYAELALHLYADYCPGRLMDFLQGSQTYPLEAALEVAQQRELIDEQVYVLSRMGNNRAALRLIIREQQDIPRAIEFVRLQADEELWEELIDWALSSADTTGQLLDHIGGNINPLRVIQKIPEGLAIDKLRDRLRAIISDFRTQTSLREGCNAILRSDCLHLVQRLQREVKRAMPTVWLQRLATHGAAAAAAAAAAADGSSDTAAAAAATDEAGAAGAAAAAGAASGPKASTKGGSAAGVAAAAAAAAAMAAAGGSSYLPHGLGSSKGPQWLKFQPGSGRAMQPASSQDVPAMAAHALATLTAAAAGGVGGTAGAGAVSRAAAAAAVSVSPALAAKGQHPFRSYGSSHHGLSSLAGVSSSSSIGLPAAPAQPSKVWIGRSGAAAEEGLWTGGAAVGGAQEGLSAGPVGEAEDDRGAVSAAAGAGGSAAGRSAWQASSRQQAMRQRGAGAVSLPSLVAA